MSRRIAEMLTIMPKPVAPSNTQGQLSKRVRKPFPSFDLTSTLAIASAIADQNAGKPWSRLSLAEAIGRKPDSSAFRELLSASIQYGLTEGSYKAEKIRLTDLGQAATMPKSPGERQRALIKAARSIALYSELYEKYDQSKLPAEANFRNTLIRDHGIDAIHAVKAIDLFRSDGKFTGLIRVVAGADRIDVVTAMERLGSDSSPSNERQGEVHEEPDDIYDNAPSFGNAPDLPGQATQTPAAGPTPQNAIFIAYGHDRSAVESLQDLLREMGVEYKVAKDEAHAGRPISQKVADLMKQCSAGIFVASADDKGLDTDGNSIMRARQNVVYELGAASLLYGQRIVIFKEKGVEFPTDFSDLGYIEYERGNLAAKFADLIRELVKLKAVKISAGG